jgi:DNA-binding response OmpR family regulator
MQGDTILFITEDLGLSRLVAEALDQHGLSLSRESDVGRSLAACAANRCSLVLVDAVADGVALPLLVHEVRRRAAVPLIVISFDRDPINSASLLDSGADDCIGRPVDRDDLVARIRAVLRRSRRPLCPTREVVRVGDMRIDPTARTVSVNGNVVDCTTLEYDIVEYLARHAGTVVSRDQLFAAVCGRDASSVDRAIDVHISHLRRKLQPHGQRIVTVRGAGYLLAQPDGPKP